jgi:hypothetical protein
VGGRRSVLGLGEGVPERAVVLSPAYRSKIDHGAHGPPPSVLSFS